MKTIGGGSRNTFLQGKKLFLKAKKLAGFLYKDTKFFKKIYASKSGYDGIEIIIQT